MSCICVTFVCLIFTGSSPSSLSVEPGADVVPETDAAPVTGYTVDDQPFSAKQRGKQNPLEHTDITHSFSLMLALDFATVIVCSYSDA